MHHAIPSDIYGNYFLCMYHAKIIIYKSRCVLDSMYWVDVVTQLDILRNQLRMNYWGCKDDTAVKSTSWSSKGLRFNFQNSYRDSQPSATLGLEDLHSLFWTLPAEGTQVIHRHNISKPPPPPTHELKFKKKTKQMNYWTVSTYGRFSYFGQWNFHFSSMSLYTAHASLTLWTSLFLQNSSPTMLLFVNLVVDFHANLT